jgi:flagellar biosynthesis protein FliR
MDPATLTPATLTPATLTPAVLDLMLIIARVGTTLAVLPGFSASVVGPRLRLALAS